MAPHGVEGSRIRFSWHRGESEVIWLPLDATSSTPLFVKVLVGYAAVRLVRAWSRGKKRRAIPMVVVSSTQHLRNTAQVHLTGSGPTEAVLRAVCIVD